MDLDQVTTFLTLADELHFGRTAERLHVAQSRVSRLIAALERQVGGQLFERSSRRVELTALGAQLRDDWGPAYEALLQGLSSARAAAAGAAAPLQVGFTITTGGYRLNRLVRVFEAQHPQWPVVLRELDVGTPFEALRRREVDVLAQWELAGMPGLVCGAVIGTEPRVLAVAADSPLAAQASVSGEVLGDWPVSNFHLVDERIRNLIIPVRTPSGRPVRLAEVVSSTAAEVISLVARGMVVHPTVASFAQLAYGQGVALVPLTDMPPLRLALYWLDGNGDPRVRALAETARSGDAASPGPAMRAGHRALPHPSLIAPGAG
jgi:DNA-binding transcriptional LysR family regulator